MTSRVGPNPMPLDRTESEPPEAAKRLLAAANQLASVRGDIEHERVIHALERLADALEVIAPERADDIIRVRQSAIELSRSAPEARVHSALVRAGLEAAARVLAGTRPPDDAEPPSIHTLRLREASLAVANATAALDPDRPLLEQYGYVRVAIRESTRAVFAAVGAADPNVLVHTATR
jgi:streptomycin 6-kinase